MTSNYFGNDGGEALPVATMGANFDELKPRARECDSACTVGGGHTGFVVKGYC